MFPARVGEPKLAIELCCRSDPRLGVPISVRHLSWRSDFFSMGMITSGRCGARCSYVIASFTGQRCDAIAIFLSIVFHRCSRFIRAIAACPRFGLSPSCGLRGSRGHVEPALATCYRHDRPEWLTQYQGTGEPSGVDEAQAQG